MTRPEPAGVGTADEVAQTIVWDLTNEIVPCHVRDLDALRKAIACAITASRRQAKEEDAKIADDFHVVAAMYAGHDGQKVAGDLSAQIATTIRKTIDA